MPTEPTSLSPLALALVGAGVTASATSIGALPAIFVKHATERTQDVLLGFSAGVMLAATCFSLIIPALAQAETQLGEGIWSGTAVAGCVLLGGVFLHLCNRYIPHEHFVKGEEGKVSSVHLKRIWLFVLAITLHNFPEGLAVGSGMGSMDLAVAIPILAGIGMQDMPEGFVVALALVGVGYTTRQALAAAFVTGLVEALAALLGFVATALSVGVLAWALAFSGGAMLYVVSNEMIPESHKDYAKEATAGLMIGFVLMMILDTSLG
jgi:ZIP family zinc transporter